MAHDIFDYKDGWEQDIDEDEVIDLEEDARKQRQELLAQQWREGELFVTSDYVLVYENPTDPSPVVCEFEPDTVILLSSLQESSNYGGFRDVLLPIRGWVWTSVDEYDRAFHDASMLLRNVQTRDTSTSMQRLGKYVKRKVHKINKKKRSKRAGSDKTNDSTEFDVETRQYAFSDAELMKSDHHSRGKTNHLYVNQQQHEAKKQSEFAADDHSIDAAEYTPEPPSVHSMHGIEFSTSLEHSSKYRRMSHQVHYNPAAIEKISKPLSLEELEAFENEIDPAHIQTDSDGVFLGNTKKDEKKEALIDDKEKEKEEEEEEEEVAAEQETLMSRISDSRTLRRIIHFVRSNPALLTLIYIVFTGFVEGIIFFDLVTDVMVAGGLQSSRGMQSFFVISSVLIITPYFIAWSSVWGLIEKKREVVNAENNNKSSHIIFGSKRRYRIFVSLFSFAPCGVILLILFDLWIVFEFIVIRPIYFLLRFRLFRTDTFEELGYRKLRRVSEVCSESLFQAFVQLSIILAIKRYDDGGEDADITVLDVTISLFASFFVIALWCGILRIESASNGISLFEYLPIVLQGSFKFVPFLPAIEKGTKNGVAVNWCLFKFDLNALTALGRALGAPNCALQVIKVSRKTFKKLPRFGCKLFGRLMNGALSHSIRVIISRLDSDMEQLFRLFDTTNTKYFNFVNFCRATLALRAQDNERLKYHEISTIFYELAANKKYELEEEERDKTSDKIQKVWLLDLTLKFRTSKQYISILDILAPEDYAVAQNDVNLLTFVRSMGNRFQSDNHEENVIQAVCANKLDIAHVLTEDDGIPIVVEITEGMELLASYMEFHQLNSEDSVADRTGLDNNDSVVQKYHRLNRMRQGESMHVDDIFSDVSIYVAVSMCEQEKSTQSTKETVNQFWNERLLFLIPYSVIDDIQNDATLTLARQTDHHEHFSDLYNNASIRTGHTRRASFFNIPVQLPAYTNTATSPKMTEKKKVAFAIQEEEEECVAQYHHNTDTVVVVRQMSEDEEVQRDHKTGLTQRLEHLFHAKNTTMSSDLPPDIVPNESPHASSDDVHTIPIT
eukprot:59325_1